MRGFKAGHLSRSHVYKLSHHVSVVHALAPGYGLEDVRPLLARYLEILEEEFGSRPVSVAVFGSVARGEARAS
ncbi:MAG: hypothetical protein DRJ96_08810 [Thermoprotei archaeon]|nr:MAG: hypothetical protein DRJ96_08810 [Thermoprotei archaeon]